MDFAHSRLLFRRRPAWTNFLLAALMTAIGLIFARPLSAQHFWILMLLPVGISAALGGIGAGLFATIIVFLGADSSWTGAPQTPPVALDFIIVAMILAVIVGSLSGARQRAAQARLLQSATLTSIADALVVVNPNDHIVFLNQRAEDLTGWSEAEVLGHPLRDILDRLDDPLGSTDLTGEFLLVNRDGRKIPVDGRGASISAEDGRILGRVLVYRDCTERYQTEEALRNSETKFATFFRASPTGIAISRRSDGMIIDANDAWLRMFGYVYDEVIGQTAVDLRLHFDPNQAEALLAALAEKSRIDMLDVTFRRKSGEIMNGLISIDLITLSGEVYILSSILDNTTQKRLQESIRKSHLQLRHFIEQAPIAIAMLNRNLHYMATSRRWIEEFGRGHRSLVGRNHLDINPDLPDSWRQICKNALNGQSASRDDDLWVREDGSKHWLRWSIHPWLDETETIGGVILAAEDITESKMAADSLRESWARYRSLFDNMLDGFAYCEMIYAKRVPIDFVFLDVNPAFEKLTGLKNVVGRQISELIPGIRKIDPELFEIYGRVASSGKSERCEIYLQSMRIWLSIAVYSPAPGHFITVFDNVTQRKQTEAKLEHLAHHDPLTDLPNRALLHTRLDHAVQMAERKDAKGAVLFLDLDHFKIVNDSLGHRAGDELLQAVALRLAERMRTTDTLARLGGDEFIILLEDLASAEDAARVAQELIHQLQIPFDLPDGTRMYAGASVGISMFPENGIDAETLIQHADTALYKAKDAGRNTFRFYTTAQTDSANERLSLEAALRRALEHGEFLLHYQPLVALPQGRAIGVEALVRWRKPDGTMVAPGAFIPLAEETGLIVPLGEWVLRAACTTMKGWLDAGLRLQTMAVNLSPRQFRHANLRDMIQSILEETGLPPHVLELEITEGALMERGAETVDRLEALKNLGVRLAIDDFGTGYSSLAYLKRFPVDKLKVDQSFVRDIPHDSADMEITATIIAMARNLKLDVLAEGIETAGQLEFLNRHQCKIGQGYFFSRPVTTEEFQIWLHTNHAPDMADLTDLTSPKTVLPLA